MPIFLYKGVLLITYNSDNITKKITTDMFLAWYPHKLSVYYG